MNKDTHICFPITIIVIIIVISGVSSFPVGVRSIVISVSVCVSLCLFACLFVCLFIYLFVHSRISKITRPNFTEFYVLITRRRGSVIL